MKLYSKLSEVYEAMYTTFINYEEEYKFYNKILSKHKKLNLLEIGSGTGNLAIYFEENGYEYCGLDLSKEMVDISKRKLPLSKFIVGDMRTFTTKNKVDSVIVTGRTISYLLSNNDLMSAFASIYENLKIGGIISFDFIDANRFIPRILKGEKITHEAIYKGVQYKRKSKWELSLKAGMDFIWHSEYSKKVGDKFLKIEDDTSIVRTFTKDEIEIFLLINNFEIKEVINRETYAFPTYVIVAEKIEK
ncbi:class I SAM-dependent methyltransferase [uncultured Aquimarina sp.]|uniref:class I SAM-dependent DNA methyltransferase n=1 Tax=uncultured Aquimarina sp. TaxID=575652 RepID=UPI00261BC608|nr:class I SAM-dependent methyltransferase [uncultured Aquimarina sp.]